MILATGILLAFVIGTLFALALCRTAANGDRQEVYCPECGQRETETEDDEP
jgi:hypothetical protein